jgi:hypothetical protein
MKSNKEQNKAAAKTFVTQHEGKRHHQKPATHADAKKDIPTKKRKNANKGRLGSLLGHSVVSVIRCMGKNNWTFTDASTALMTAGIKAAEHTIKIGLKRGRDGQKRIAPLSAKELSALKVKSVAQPA